MPIISLDAADASTLIFGEFLIWKTRANLEKNPRVAVIVVTENLETWTIKGRFRCFEAAGPFVEALNQKQMFRYNAYVGIRRAAVIDVEEVTNSQKMVKLALIADLLRVKFVSRLAGLLGKVHIPDRVAEKFARLQAVKVIAFRGQDGYPRIVPVLSLMPSRAANMIFRSGTYASQLQELLSGSRIAASVLTMEPLAYQVKGVYVGPKLTPLGSMEQLRIDEVYSASPPLSGQRIELQTYNLPSGP